MHFIWPELLWLLLLIPLLVVGYIRALRRKRTAVVHYPSLGLIPEISANRLIVSPVARTKTIRDRQEMTSVIRKSHHTHFYAAPERTISNNCLLCSAERVQRTRLAGMHNVAVGTNGNAAALVNRRTTLNDEFRYKSKRGVHLGGGCKCCC